ncbi:MAG: hypothetical protein JRH20_27410 [Deltaproteobacteria bacterium]|nr:hypothetical protein [Deltaproteobacteria bacterium]
MKNGLLIACATLVFVLTGCKDDTPQARRSPDVAGPSRSEDPPPPYKVRIQVGAPCYLCNDVSPNTRILVDLKDTTIHIADAKQMAMGQMVLESFPGRTSIKGRWDIRDNLTYYFVPDQPLAPGDYLVRFPNAGADLKVTPAPYNLFRVGPGPTRLRTIELYADKSDPSGGLAKVVAILTTLPDATFTTALQKEVDDHWQTITLRKGDKPGESIKANPSDTIPTDKRLRITVRSDLLDGAYNGLPASKKELTVEFRPQDISGDPRQVIYYVPPQLGIDLLTGKPQAE